MRPNDGTQWPVDFWRRRHTSGIIEHGMKSWRSISAWKGCRTHEDLAIAQAWGSLQNLEEDVKPTREWILRQLELSLGRFSKPFLPVILASKSFSEMG